MVLFGGCIVAHVGAMWRRAGRQRAVAGEGMPGGTAGERRRGRRIGADVPTLTSPDFVLTSGAQVAPTCGAVAGGHRPRWRCSCQWPPSGRCRSWSYEAGPAADSASAPSALPYMRPPAATPQPSPPQRRRASDPGSPLVADAMPVDPTCKPRPGSRRSAGRRRPAGAHTGAVPSRVPAVPRKETWAQLSFPHPTPRHSRLRGNPGTGQSGVSPTPLLPRNPPPTRPSRQRPGIQGRGRAACLPPPCSPPPPTLPHKAVAGATANKQTPFLSPFQLQKPRQKSNKQFKMNGQLNSPAAERGEHRSRHDQPVVDSASRLVQTIPSGGGFRRGRCEGHQSS